MNYSAGLDLGGTLIKLALVAPEGHVLASHRVRAEPNRPADRVFAGLRPELERMARECGLPYPPPAGCGVGIPGLVEPGTGRLRFSGPYPWRNLDLAAVAERALSCRVAVNNDVNAGVLAELWYGAARESQEVIFIAWGTGIGAAFVVNRRLYHTQGCAMSNLGHMPADPASDRLCYCGCRGCLEIETGGQAMVEQAVASLRAGERSVLAEITPPLTPQHLAEATAAGDALARRILERSAVLIARTLAGLLAFLTPDTVIFSGGVARCFPLIRNVFDEELRRRTPEFALPLTRIVFSQFADQAGVIGASVLPRVQP